MRRSHLFLKDTWRESLFVALLTLAEGALELLIPLCIAALIDRGIPAGYMSRILARGLGLAALGAGSLACAAAAQTFAAKISAHCAAKLRRALFHRALALSCTQLDGLGATTLTARLADVVAEIQSCLEQMLHPSLHAPILFFGAAMIAFHISTRAGRIFAAVIPALLATTVVGFRILLPQRRRAKKHMRDLALRTQENLTGARVLRAFDRQEAENEAFRCDQDRYMRAETVADRTEAWMHSLFAAAIGLTLFALLRSAAAQAETETLTTGQLTALLCCAALIFAALSELASLVVATYRMNIRLQCVRDLLELRPALRSPAKPLRTDPVERGRVNFIHVCLKPAGCRANVLHDIHFSARRGQFIGILGDTGAGKTALLNLIPRLCDASSGAILVRGTDVRKQSLSELRARIGIASQRPLLFRGTVRDNLRFGDPSAAEADLLEALHIVQASEVLSAMGGLDAKIEPNGTNLPEALQQQLAIARALVRKPEILILDECTSALDFAVERHLRLALRRLPYRPTIFFATQCAASVRYADRILVLNDGCIVGIGTHEQLLERCQIYREQLDTRSESEVSA